MKKRIITVVVCVTAILILTLSIISLSMESFTSGGAVAVHGKVSAVEGTDTLPPRESKKTDPYAYASEESYMPPDGISFDNASYRADATGFVDKVYRVMLGRTPDEEGSAYWSKVLTSEELSAYVFIMSILSSEEYYSKEKSATEKIYDLYLVMTGAIPESTPPESAMLDACMSEWSVVNSIGEKDAFKDTCAYFGIARGSFTPAEPRDQNFVRTAFVAKLYENFLYRKPDIDGLNFWCERLTGEMSASEVAQYFAFGYEYMARRTDNEEYIISLCNTFFNRDPYKNETEEWTDMLDHTNTREHLFNVFLQSDEFHSMCSKAAMEVGVPMEEPDESDEWQFNIRALKLINEKRTGSGLEKLATREDIWKDISMTRVSEVSAPSNHFRPGGRSCFSIYTDNGILKYTYAAEITGTGRIKSPERLIELWSNSPGENAVLMNTDPGYVAITYSDIARGHDKNYCLNYWIP